jgi:hypothetical protein
MRHVPPTIAPMGLATSHLSDDVQWCSVYSDLKNGDIHWSILVCCVLQSSSSLRLVDPCEWLALFVVGETCKMCLLCLKTRRYPMGSSLLNLMVIRPRPVARRWFSNFFLVLELGLLSGCVWTPFDALGVTSLWVGRKRREFLARWELLLRFNNRQRMQYWQPCRRHSSKITTFASSRLQYFVLTLAWHADDLSQNLLFPF